MDTILNWGDPSGSDYEGEGQIVMVDAACSATGSYTSADGQTFTQTNLEALKGYACGSLPSGAAGNWQATFKSKAAYKDAYGLLGCKAGESSAGSICNATHFVEGQPWATSRSLANVYMEPAVAGAVNVHYAAGTPFSDLAFLIGRPLSITFRAGARVNAVSVTWGASAGSVVGGLQGTQSHGGTGGSPTTVNGLADDPIVQVELCSVTQDQKMRTGSLKLVTRSGKVYVGGKGRDSCQTVAPSGKILYGFYGRAGDELDSLGTYWGDATSAAPSHPSKGTPR